MLYGGSKMNNEELKDGNFFCPTILEASTDNLCLKEEIFGPVFSMVKYKNDEEAVKIANNTNYGLGGSIMSKDLDKAEKMAS